MKENNVHQIDIKDKRQLKRFVRLERKLLRHHEHYISPIDQDILKHFTGRTKLFESVDFALFIAIKDNEDIGRCAAIINRKYQNDKNEQVGSIGFFAARHNCNNEIRTLIQEAENWLSSRNVKRIIAPWDGVSGTDSLNILHDELPVFPIPWYPEYYYNYFLANGYQLKYKRLDYIISFSSQEYRAAKEKYLNTGDFVVRPIAKKHWKKDVETIRVLFNITFREEWECYEYSTEEFAEIFEPMKAILDPQHILIAEINDEPIEFCFGMPDLSPIFRSLNGKLGILQILRLLVQAKKFRKAGILGIGVLPEYRGKGVSKTLAMTIYDNFEKHGLDNGSYYLVNDYNVSSRKFAESLGGKPKVLFHILDKKLS